MSRYYHIADESYQEGEPLLSWNKQKEMGMEPTWKWDDAEEGYDGDMVSLARSDGEADEVRQHIGRGKKLVVDIPDDFESRDRDAEAAASAEWPYTRGKGHPRFIQQNSEGYPAVRDFVPASWISAPETPRRRFRFARGRRDR